MKQAQQRVKDFSRLDHLHAFVSNIAGCAKAWPAVNGVIDQFGTGMYGTPYGRVVLAAEQGNHRHAHRVGNMHRAAIRTHKHRTACKQCRSLSETDFANEIMQAQPRTSDRRRQHRRGCGFVFSADQHDLRARQARAQHGDKLQYLARGPQVSRLTRSEKQSDPKRIATWKCTLGPLAFNSGNRYMLSKASRRSPCHDVQRGAHDAGGSQVVCGRNGHRMA